MLNSKLIKTIQLFNNKEMESLSHYIKCPLYNTDLKIMQFFDILKKQYPEFDLNPETLFAQLYPEKKKYDSSLRSLMSRLTKLIEDFAANMMFQKDANEQQRHILTFFNQREPESNRLLKAIQQHSQTTGLDIQDINGQIQLNNLYFENFTGKADLKLKKKLKTLMDDIDVYYIYLKLKVAIESNYKYEDDPLDSKSRINFENILELVNQVDVNQEPLLKAYYHAYHLTNESPKNQEKNFESLQKILVYKGAQIHKGELSQLYLILINFCVEKAQNGNQAYNKILLELYQNAIQQNLLRFRILPNHFMNIVILALDANQKKWTGQFIKKYKNNLPAKERQNILNFCLASFALEMGKYDIVKEKLEKQTRFSMPYYEVKRKILEIKAAYGLKDEALLEKNITKLRVYLHRVPELTTFQRKSFRNFELTIRKAQSIRSPLGLKRLKDVLNQLQPLAEKNWLIQRSIELERKILARRQGITTL